MLHYRMLFVLVKVDEYNICVDCYRNVGFYLLFISYFPKNFEQTKHGKMNTVKLSPAAAKHWKSFSVLFSMAQPNTLNFPYWKIFSPESILHSEMNLYRAKCSLNVMINFTATIMVNIRIILIHCLHVTSSLYVISRALTKAMQNLLPHKPNIIRDRRSVKNNGTKPVAFNHGHCEPIRVKCNILVTNL